MESNIDRKRRNMSSISPNAAKKQPAFSEDNKKLDIVVLQYRNRKLIQELETQKFECSILESKINQLEEKQSAYDDTSVEISKSWDQLVGNLETCPTCTHGSENGGYDMKSSLLMEVGPSSLLEEDFMSRLMATGAIDSCSDVSLSACQTEKNVQTSHASTTNILQNIVASIDFLWHVNNATVSKLCMSLEDGPNKQLQKSVNNLQLEVQSFQVAIRDLHLQHRPLANKVQNHQDVDAKNRAEHKYLEGELASAISELEEINSKLMHLRAQKDAAFGPPFLFPMLGNKQDVGDKLNDKKNELKDLESSLKNLKDVASSRLVEIRSLHEGRKDILKKLDVMKKAMLDVQSITSSKAFLSLSEQLDKSKAEMEQCRTSVKKLQVEKDNFCWHEKEVTMKSELTDAFQRLSAFSESHIAQLENDLQKLREERTVMESKLEQALKEPGMKEIITEFKAHIYSLPKGMNAMQQEISKYKKATSVVHNIRAEVQSLSSILARKVNEVESLSCRSKQQLSEIKKLQVRDLRESSQELKLFVDMYIRESTDSREVMEKRYSENSAWAHVQSLKSSLNEHNLESRVKEAIEAEAIAQQRLATTEAEIANLRQILESSKRDICNSSENLKSKHEEGKAFLSEIESIGQAYEDMQTQNQHLLQQVTERDDYNAKLVIEVMKARQQHDTLSNEVHAMYKKIQHANLFLNLFTQKVAQFDDQLKFWSEQVGRLTEDTGRNSTTLVDTQRRLTDTERDYEQIKNSLGQRQSKCAKSRSEVTELLIELEEERFKKMRIEEGFEVMGRKATRRQKQIEGSTAMGKLKQEIREYRGILKCRVCHDRQKEVVITKCYHLFCSQCIQKTLASRHKKCPLCSSNFGPNDVKPIYL